MRQKRTAEILVERLETAGIYGIRVEDPAAAALGEAFQFEGPAVITVVVNRMEPSMPPTIKLEKVIGFNLLSIKAVLNGRGNELVDLAVSDSIR
jgi:pyruvate dehydrogenase (quinone)